MVNVAIRAQSRAVTMTDATVFTSGCANPAVTTRSQRRRATLQASIASLNFGGHIILIFPVDFLAARARDQLKKLRRRRQVRIVRLVSLPGRSFSAGG